MNRELNDKQHRKLDRVHKDDPFTRVIGWMDDPRKARGPIVRHLNGTEYVINVTGHAKTL